MDEREFVKRCAIWSKININQIMSAEKMEIAKESLDALDLTGTWEYTKKM
jgi:hypothetical protein